MPPHLAHAHIQAPTVPITDAPSNSPSLAPTTAIVTAQVRGPTHVSTCGRAAASQTRHVQEKKRLPLCPPSPQAAAPAPVPALSAYVVDLQRKLNSLVVDDSAALYSIGSYRSMFRATVWPTPTTDTTATFQTRGGNDVWVQKVDPSGRTQWVAVLGSSGAEDGRSVAVDGKGDVLVAGTFVYSASHANSMLVGTIPLTTPTSPPGTSSVDVFVAKLNGNNGSVQWAKQIGGEGTDVVVSVDTTSTSGVVIAGTFNSSSLALGAGTTLTNPGTGNVT